MLFVGQSRGRCDVILCIVGTPRGRGVDGIPRRPIGVMGREPAQGGPLTPATVFIVEPCLGPGRGLEGPYTMGSALVEHQHRGEGEGEGRGCC